jgi:hypothetical protein
MAYVGLILGVVGYIALFVGVIMVTIQAFRKSALWGLGTFFLFVPVGIIYVAQNWATAKRPTMIILGGLVLAIVGSIIGGMGAASMMGESAAAFLTI